MAATNYVLAEYIWVGGRGELRSKTKVLHGSKETSLESLPSWNYDGSSTEQAEGHDSEVIIVPQKMYPDPFRRGGNNILVICDTYKPSGEPLPTNSRVVADKIFKSKPEECPWFGIEQEYTLFKDGRPLGFPKSKARTFKANPLNTFGYPAAQGPYYCSAGANVAFGRDIVEEHLEACLYAGLKISGINAEVMPGQWEVQVGPCEGINSGDEMTATRYILNRVAEKHGVYVSYAAKPVQGDWNGAGCHTNFSTKAMRENDNSLDTVIYPALDALGKHHAEHLAVYGSGNDMRLTGAHETASIHQFSYGVANRGASIRIPNVTAIKRKGYIEDRRPAADMDPYVVTSIIFDSAILGSKFSKSFDNIRTEGVEVTNVEIKQEAPEVKPVNAVVELEKAEKNVQKKSSNNNKQKAAIKKSKKSKGRGKSVTGCINQ